MPTKIRRNSLPRISLKSCQSARSKPGLSCRLLANYTTASNQCRQYIGGRPPPRHIANSLTTGGHP